MRTTSSICRCTWHHVSDTLGGEEFIETLYRDASLSQVLGEWKRLKVEEENLLEHARLTERYVSRFGEYRKSFIRRLSNRSSLSWPTGR